MKFNRVLVTGGAGFIGSHTVDLLLQRGAKVRVFDNLEPQVHGGRTTPPDYLSKEAEFVHGTVLDRDALRKAMDGCDAIIHDAAMVGVGQSAYQPERYVAANTLGTAILLDILVNDKTTVERLLVASSMSIYGEGLYRRPSDGALRTPGLRPEAQMHAGDFEVRDDQTGEALEPIGTPESKPLHCTSVYALSKKDQEEYCLVTGMAHKLSVVATRFFNVIGPRQSLSNPYTGAGAIFLSRIKNNNRPLIYEDGKQSRDFIDVRDLAAAKLFLLENESANLEAYNLCTGRATTIGGLAEILARLSGRPDLTPEITQRYRAGDVRHCFGDSSKINALGWKPQISLEQCLENLVAWSANEVAEDRVAEAHAELVRRGLVRN